MRKNRKTNPQRYTWVGGRMVNTHRTGRYLVVVPSSIAELWVTLDGWRFKWLAHDQANLYDGAVVIDMKKRLIL
mgnify:CR=1 FL=1